MFDSFRYATSILFIDKNFKLEDNDCSPEKFPDKQKFILSDREGAKMFEERIGGPLIHNLDNLTDDEIKNSVFYTFFTFDDDALPHLKRIKKSGGIFIPPILTGKVEYHHTKRDACFALIETQNIKDRISHFNHEVYNNIIEAIDITKDLEGDYCEIGVYLGGSAFLAGTYIRKLKEKNEIKNRKMFLFDTFDGFDYKETENSPDQIWKGTHKLYGIKETMLHVSQTLNSMGTPYSLYASNICTNELPSEIKKLSVVNIDVDMYEPTLDALNKVSDLVVKGGIIICEDPSSTPGLYGAYLAMNEFLESEKGKDYLQIFKGAQYFLYKR